MSFIIGNNGYTDRIKSGSFCCLFCESRLSDIQTRQMTHCSSKYTRICNFLSGDIHSAYTARHICCRPHRRPLWLFCVPVPYRHAVTYRIDIIYICFHIFIYFNRSVRHQFNSGSVEKCCVCTDTDRQNDNICLCTLFVRQNLLRLICSLNRFYSASCHNLDSDGCQMVCKEVGKVFGESR